MTIANCDFCGKKTEVVGTHYGSGFGYTRLICSDCKAELGAKSIKEEIETEVKNEKEDLQEK